VPGPARAGPRRARCAATRSMRPATSARARTAITSTDAVPASADDLLGRLRDGELEVIGRLVGSSNNAMVVRVWPSPISEGHVAAQPGRPIEGGDVLPVWKPALGGRRLFAFPAGW